MERGQLLAKIWIRYVELVNVLAMLLKVDGDSKKEKEARYLRQIEILNRNCPAGWLRVGNKAACFLTVVGVSPPKTFSHAMQYDFPFRCFWSSLQVIETPIL